MRRHFLFSALIFVISCKSREFNSTPNAFWSLNNNSQNFMWKNPEFNASNCQIKSDDTSVHPHMRGVPQGLTLMTAEQTPHPFTIPARLQKDPSQGDEFAPIRFGGTVEFDRNKHTAIFFQGYDQTGGARDFPEIKLWNDAGFNTFVFRWHCIAYQPNPIFTLNPIATLQRASHPFNAVDEAEIYFSNEYRKLEKLIFSQPYEKEIRFIGYSMSGPLALKAAFRNWVQEPESSRNFYARKYMLDHWKSPRRVDMLDPAFFFDFLQGTRQYNSTVMTESRMQDVISKNQDELDSRQNLKAIRLSYPVIASKLHADLIALASFNIGFMHPFPFLKNMHTWANVQEIDKNWMANYIEKNNITNSVVFRHHSILNYYFPSIAASAPSPAAVGKTPFLNKDADGNYTYHAIDAKTPTAFLQGLRYRLVQQSSPGLETFEMSDDLYKANEDTGLPPPSGIVLTTHADAEAGRGMPLESSITPIFSIKTGKAETFEHMVNDDIQRNKDRIRKNQVIYYQ